MNHASLTTVSFKPARSKQAAPSIPQASPSSRQPSSERTAMARASALFLLAALLAAATLGSSTAFLLPPGARQPSARARALGTSRSRLHVLDPASLPDPSTLDAAVTATQQAVETAAGAAAVVNGPNQIVDALRAYIFSPNGFGVTGLLALGVRSYTYFTVRGTTPLVRSMFFFSPPPAPPFHLNVRMNPTSNSTPFQYHRPSPCVRASARSLPRAARRWSWPGATRCGTCGTTRTRHVFGFVVGPMESKGHP